MLRLDAIVALLAATTVVLFPAHAGFAESKSLSLENLPPPTARRVDFASDIKPLLTKNCFHCHGPDIQEAGLRLDIRAAASKGADSGPVIVPGKSAQSRLIHLVAGLDKESGRMPPEDAADPLTVEQIGLLRAWIDQGAVWPASADGDNEAAKGKDLWSLKPIARPVLPKVTNDAWIRNPIDTFILAKLEHEHVAPSAETDRVTLLRRVFLDLTGLPPTQLDVQSFLADKHSDAYERVVDRLLASSHYGERWGRHWLDLAHYADSDGYEKDLGRPFAWRYRDWVIQAINSDMSYSTFTVQQLAGDLLTPNDPEYDETAPVASGFQRNTLINKEGGVDPEEDRVKRTIDRTNTLGAVWLGLTVGCANCHSHKYDPISQQEYFGLYAFFNNLREVDLSLISDNKVPIAADFTPREVLSKNSATYEQGSNADTTSHEPKADANSIESTTSGTIDHKLFQAVAEEASRRETYVHQRGDFLAKGSVVEPRAPEVLPPLHARGPRPDRLDLARWLVSDEHPLTARVVVNRLWQTYFGRGLVSTVDDFGTQGEPPSHPELLNWLASELRSGGWRMKRLHRLIVTSATYRQSSAARPELTDRDPYNTWLARQNRLRVEAEIIRDLALAASGLLNPEIGGQSIRPRQPAGVSDVTFDNSAKWVESAGADRYRRGLYIWFQRTSPYPSLVGFDAPEAVLACTRRDRSDTPLQSLTLLNDSVYVECAQALGHRMMAEVCGHVAETDHAADDRIRYAFEIALSRKPSPAEFASLRNLYDEAQNHYRSAPDAAQRLTGSLSAADLPHGAANTDEHIADAGACVAVARAILNLDEFITRE